MRPRVSVVVPVLDEAATIQACVDGIRAVDGGTGCEVIVVDGDPGGSTLSALADGDAVTMTAPRGRALQMNAGAARACGDIVLFLHADTFLPATAISDMAAVLGDGRTVGGAFSHRFDSPRAGYRLMSALVTRWTRRARLPFGDQAIFLCRAYFDAIGGYAPVEVMEDWELVRRIKRRGDRLCVLPAAARTSCRRLQREGPTRRVVKNAWMCMLAACGVPASRLARLYRPLGRADDEIRDPPRPVAPARDNP